MLRRSFATCLNNRHFKLFSLLACITEDLKACISIFNTYLCESQDNISRSHFTIANYFKWKVRWHHLIINMYMMSSRHICVLSIFGTLHLCFSPTLYCIHHSQISKKVIIYICSVVGQRNKYEMIDTVIKLPTVNLKKLKRNYSLDY